MQVLALTLILNNMDTSDAFRNPNPIIGDSILGTKYLNPEYLFNNLIDSASYIFNNFFTEKTLNGFYIALSFLSLFLIAVIIYTTIRMFEIRRKEHLHLQHEIAEYAHKQALKEGRTEAETTEMPKSEHTA